MCLRACVCVCVHAVMRAFDILCMIVWSVLDFEGLYKTQLFMQPY